jgi:RNA polymerase sigma-70 factor (ECF subfamily)
MVAAHGERVARLVSRLLGWRQDVDDVVQDIFVKVLAGLPRFRGQSRVDTWITRIAINVCRTHARRRWLSLRWFGRNRPDLLVEREAPAAMAETADAAELERVRAVVRAMPRRDREVLVLRYFEEMSNESMAEVLGLSRNAVDVRLTRARQKLRARLNRSAGDN